MTSRQILIWEMIGALVISMLGSVSHFVYGWLNHLKASALFFAVNESTWEHLKLAFWPTILWSVIEWRCIARKTKNFLIAKTLSLYLTPVIITVFFYVYMAIFSKDSLMFDISLFVLAVIAGQFASFKVLTGGPLPENVKKAAFVLLIFIALSFLFFTYFAPPWFLFLDPITGGYGIVN